MVKVCEYNYPKENETNFSSYYQNYSYELHDFQKWAIEGLVTGNHVLITAPTGSGKTFGGEFAIHFFHSKGKKIIYTSPIKALSNEKFYSFTQKYPHISVGLITGDIKTNPNADVLIMTTEILLNKLYQIKSKNPNLTSSVSFEMDIQNELGCVVFDEIHFLNDESRGHVWEQTIMMLPPHVQMVGLSATLDNPEKFANWLEKRGNAEPVGDKIVYLAKKLVRSAPLIHYSFITTNASVNKTIKDKSLQEEIRNITNKPIVIQNAQNVFNEVNYLNVSKTLKLFEKNEIRIRRQHVLNNIAEYLVQNEMLPALCYVFSRKQLEKCAEEMTTNLLEFDSKVPYIVDRECEQIVRKLPNYEEYLHLPEYINTVKLLRKGVGIHHAGLIPILREMTEMLFARGFIKILFCTETMSVGINLPVKTTIFTDICKFNGENMRFLHSHEYTQAAGRAGRLGLDKVGHVIHLNNLFRNVDSVSYKQMMNGKPQVLKSKFRISYNLLLNLLDIGDNNLISFAKKSMVINDLDSEMRQLLEKETQLRSEMEKSRECIIHLKTPEEIINEYIELVEQRPMSVNKKRKEIDRRIGQIIDEYKTIENDKASYSKMREKQNQLSDLENEKRVVEKFVDSGVLTVIKLLHDEGFVEPNGETFILTKKGMIASQLREVHCLVFGELLSKGVFDTMDAKEMIEVFSCFTNISVNDDRKEHNPNSKSSTATNLIKQINNMYDDNFNKEIRNNLNTGIDYSMHYDLIKYVSKWCECENVEECKLVLQDLATEKDIFLGEFVKSLMKINNIANEMEKIAEMTGDMSLLGKLKEVSQMTLKYVVTNQSLYV